MAQSLERCQAPNGPQWHITIHSSGRAFGTPLNSGVRPAIAFRSLSGSARLVQFASSVVIGRAHGHQRRNRSTRLRCSSWRWSPLGKPIGISGAIACRTTAHVLALVALKLLAALRSSRLLHALKRLLATYRSSKVHRFGITLAQLVVQADVLTHAA